MICLLMYILAIVGVYAYPPRQRSTDRAAHDLTLSFVQGCFLLLKSPDPLPEKGCIKKEQPPFGSCSLFPEGFHSIYFIPYI